MSSIPVEAYLRTAYDNPDRKFRDGEVIERALPDLWHSTAQMSLMELFWKIGLMALPSLRLRLRHNLVRVPDLCVFYPNKPTENIPSKPPFIAIEILSPEERMSKVREKLEEYRAWGVPHVWLVDPHGKRMYTCDAGLVEVSALRIPELNLEVRAKDIFEESVVV